MTKGAEMQGANAGAAVERPGAMGAELLEGVAREYGTPAYVFDLDAFTRRLEACREIVPGIGLCFAMKANPFLAPHAAAHADLLEVCSPGELEICQATGVPGDKIVYSGVNKGVHDVAQAISYNVNVVTLESLLQARMVSDEGVRQGRRVPAIARLAAGSQFGMDRDDLLSVFTDPDAYPGLELEGIHYFVGTQRTHLKRQLRELDKLEALIDQVEELTGKPVKRLEYGPGLAVPYFEGDDFSDDLAPLRGIAERLLALSSRVELTIEMGRFFAAPCGSYLTRAVDIKGIDDDNYAILDGGTNHLVYAGQMMGLHVPMVRNLGPCGEACADGADAPEPREWTLCGSLCSVNDVLVRSISMPLSLGDVLAFDNAGAYAMTEGLSLFLSRALPAVVFAQDGRTALVRRLTQTSPLNTPC